AEATGIAANLRVGMLRRRLAELAEAAVPGARVIDLPQIEGHLLALLHDSSLLATPAVAPVHEYLYAAGANPDALDRRRCQLAAELAQLFDEYAGSRPEMLEAWPERALLGDREAFASTEAWQRALWLALFGPGGRVKPPWAR